MPIDYDYLMSLRSRDVSCAYRERDSMFYALAVGMGRDPLNLRELPFVYEGAGVRTVPAMAGTLISTDFLRDCGWDYRRVLHGEERLTLHRPLADSGSLLVDTQVTELVDRGEGEGAFIYVESKARSAVDGEPLFRIGRTIVARGDGGCGGGTRPVPVPHPMPAGDPDLVCTFQTRRDQALLYRLCGDRNPLHADPILARKLGLQAPILHGLCTYGIACRAILKTICEYDHTLITVLDVRFTAPVYPGETLVTEMWQVANVVSFRVRSEERDIVVLNHGRCVLAT